MNERPYFTHHDLPRLLNEIDNLIDPSIHPELAKTGQTGKLLKLQMFASRVVLANEKLVTRLEKIKNLILEKPTAYRDPGKFRKMLEKIEQENEGRFRGKTEGDFI